MEPGVKYEREERKEGQSEPEEIRAEAKGPELAEKGWLKIYGKSTLLLW